MKKLILITISLFSCMLLMASKHDTLAIKNIEQQYEQLSNDIKEVRRDELNYKIEKDLLKETYSNNYDRISLIITIVLALIGILGYLGLKDINTIKKEYEKELHNLRNIQSKFNSKALEFDSEKKKFDEELKNIIKENEEQNRKIKFIELKDKVRALLKDDDMSTALEFVNAALEINGKDLDLLNQKGRILCRKNQFNGALETYKHALTLYPTDKTAMFNIVECYYFIKDITNAKLIIQQNKSLFDEKAGGRLIELFNLYELYHEDKKDELLKIAKSYVDLNNLNSKSSRIHGWDLKEALYFIHYQPDSEIKVILKNILIYWNGIITGETLLKSLNIELPKNPMEKK